MDEPLHEAPSADDWRSTLALRVQEQRHRAREQFDERRGRLRELEAALAAQLDAVSLAVAHEQRAVADDRSDLYARSAAIEQKQQDLSARQQELDRRQQTSDSSQRDADRRQQQVLEEVARRLNELERRQGDLAAEDQRLQQRQVALARREAELDNLSGEIDRRQASLSGSSSDLDRQRAELEAARAAQRSETELLHAERTEVRKLQAELALQQQQIAEREHHTQRQRRQIAQQLRAKKQELTAEIELHRAEALASNAGQELQLQIRLSELQGKYERLKEEFDHRDQDRQANAERLADLKAQLDARNGELSQQKLALDEAQRQKQAAETARHDLEAKLKDLQTNQAAAQGGQVDLLQRQIHDLEKAQAAGQAEWNVQRLALESDLAQARKASKAGGDSAAELARLREENKQLETWLGEAEEKAKQAGSGDNQELEDLRRRFEMAVQDVRELKTKNAELSDQLAKARQPGRAAAADSGGSDWESMKRRMLAQLETDFEPADEKQSADKLTVEGAIKITDRVVAEKEHEIQELRQLLDSQAQNVGEMAVGAAAIAQALDSDELVQQERANLKQLQDALREQLRKAEVDISLERAKLARERAELDEKLRTLESERGSGTAGDSGSDKGKKQAGRGKWLARLGLQGGKDE
jgi:chromosome segregation ATPase